MVKSFFVAKKRVVSHFLCFTICFVGILSTLLFAGCGETAEADIPVRVGSLKGPTSIGLMKMMQDNESKDVKGRYTFEMAVTADELLPRLLSNDLDIALVPANAAVALYAKSQGAIKVIDINTLGVLYAVSGDDSITEVKNLIGKTVYITNRGTAPDYVTQYLLQSAGVSLSDVTIEYKSEATEVAALLSANPDAVGILPQPFVTAACIQNDSLSPVLDLTKEWERLNGNGKLLTGVTVVSKAFADKYPDAVSTFMEEHKSSVEYVSDNPEEVATLVVQNGIIEKEPVAQKAIPACNVTYIDGEEMQEALAGYLQVLFDMDPKSVGGSMPADDFYYR